VIRSTWHLVSRAPATQPLRRVLKREYGPELGGSNNLANFYPEKANAHPGYHVKDKLEIKLHGLV
jgi:hypothetical protein